MDLQVWMASKEVADRLDVHVRTLRNWLDLFVPVQEKLKNPQGHYLISDAGYHLLKEVKQRKDSGNSSLRDIQRQFIDEGLLSEDMLIEEEITAADQAIAITGTMSLNSGMRELETSVQDALLHFQHELSQLSSMSQLQSAILQKVADIEEMQESLRLEMRRVTFEMDLMHQRLTRRKARLDKYESRFSLNPFRWFTRSSPANRNQSNSLN